MQGSREGRSKHLVQHSNGDVARNERVSLASKQLMKDVPTKGKCVLKHKTKSACGARSFNLPKNSLHHFEAKRILGLFFALFAIVLHRG